MNEYNEQLMDQRHLNEIIGTINASGTLRYLGEKIYLWNANEGGGDLLTEIGLGTAFAVHGAELALKKANRYSPVNIPGKISYSPSASTRIAYWNVSAKSFSKVKALTGAAGYVVGGAGIALSVYEIYQISEGQIKKSYGEAYADLAFGVIGTFGGLPGAIVGATYFLVAKPLVKAYLQPENE